MSYFGSSDWLEIFTGDRPRGQQESFEQYKIINLAGIFTALSFLVVANTAIASQSMIALDKSSGIYGRPGSAIRFRQITRSLKLPQKDGTEDSLGGQTWAIAWGDANNNLYPDLYLNHHTGKSTGRPEVFDSHLVFDPGAPGGATSHSNLPGWDQHGAIFVDINSDGQEDLLELQGGLAGRNFNPLKQLLTTEFSPGIRNQLLIGENGAFSGPNVAREYNLEYPLGRGRNPIPLNINGKLGVLLANASRTDKQYPTTFFIAATNGSFEERRDYFRAQPCPEPKRTANTCTSSEAADLNSFQLALPGYFNHDKYQDVIFLAAKSDGGNPVELFIGSKDGPFTLSPHAGPEVRVKDATVLDADNDGHFDVWLAGKHHIGNKKTAGNSLYSFDPEGRFLNQSLLADATDPPLQAVSVVAGDFDNDGDEDVATYEKANDNLFHFSIWENFDGGKYRRTRFKDSQNPGHARNVAIADYNLDGSLDLLFGDGRGTPAEVKDIGGYILLEGLPNGRHWLQIDLVDPWNLRGLGAQVFVTAGKTTMVRGQFGGVHEATQNHSRLHFGLDKFDRVDVRVLWPDGSGTELKGVAVNQILQVTYPVEP